MAADSPESRWFIAQRLRLHYVDWGNAGAPPLLLLHGGRDHCRSWDWVARDLRRDFHVIAPDLRGHGDSEWAPGGTYSMASYVYDLAQLIHQEGLAPLTIVAHSLGGHIALRYAGLYPEAVSRLVAIEGLGPSPALLAERAAKGIAQRTRDWIGEQRALSRRQPRRYPSVEAALARMQAGNAHLSLAQARHLTEHGLRRNEDGSYSWKFDNRVRSLTPGDMTQDEIHALWGQIICPTLLVYGRESWATNPAEDGRLAYFGNAEVALFDGAGHWVHHDRTEAFLARVRAFLAEECP
jgi:pimeloyl-ACP methyl ester carboxylesterase